MTYEEIRQNADAQAYQWVHDQPEWTVDDALEDERGAWNSCYYEDIESGEVDEDDWSYFCSCFIEKWEEYQEE